jgi:glycosyltransferase involved in cell wall biosynthesis
MYAGKPIVASYRTLFDPVEQAGCGITVAPGSPTEIKDAILKLKNSREKRIEMGINARAYFDANHDFNVIGDSYFKKMRELRNNG